MKPKVWKKMFKTKRLKAIGNDRLMATAYHEAGHCLIVSLRPGASCPVNFEAVSCAKKNHGKSISIF